MDSRVRSRQMLQDWCRRSDGGPYPAYRDLHGRFQLDGLDLDVLRVQPDPFAGPSRIRLIVPFSSTALDPEVGRLAGGGGARTPGWIDPASARALGIRDYLGRAVGLYLQRRAQGGGGRPQVSIDRHGQQVLDRSAVILRPDSVEVRLEVSLPARGRRILGRQAMELLLELPERLVKECLGREALDPERLRHHWQVVEDFAFLQEELERRGWVAFVADGSRLARRAGHDDRPLREGEVVPFASPPELRAEVRLPHQGPITGMALPPGVTLLCGGGFHGKSTLLRALAAAVFPHVPGDGRERVATRGDALSIRAEDGRAVASADLSPFLHDLPFNRPSDRFTTDNASGSTSQAAAILEAIQGGSRLLLIDEDTSATNFMIRDPLMEALLSARQEPITPFLHRARILYEGMGVSTILVIGGSGEYFRVADRVILLDTYRPADATARAQEIVSPRGPIPPDAAGLEALRRATRSDRALPAGPVSSGARPRGPAGGRELPRVKALDARRLLIGRIPLELGGMEGLRDLSQARFLARALAWRFREQKGRNSGMNEATQTVAQLRDAFLREWGRSGLDGFDREPRGDLAAVRFLELLAGVNRLRERPAPGGDWALPESGGEE